MDVNDAQSTSNASSPLPKSDAIVETDESQEASNDEDVPSAVPTLSKRRKRKVYNGMIECNVDPIRSLIICSLCDGLYREPYTTLKCFHTFCKSCLVTAIKSTYNTPEYNCCPTCAIYFGRDDVLTNVALPDRILETIIDKVIFPDIASQDYANECEFYAQRGIERKDATTEQSLSSAAPLANLVPVKKDRTDPMNDPKDTVSFLLLPKKLINSAKPTPPPLKFPRLTTSVQLRVEQIKKLLLMKLSSAATETKTVETRDDFAVYCNGCLLEEELTLRFISYAIWKDPNSTLTLEYDFNHG